MRSPTPIYLDYAATTPPAPEVIDAMLPMYREHWGNPSSTHARGRTPRAMIDEARGRVATWIGAAPANIAFTSGGTEADNIAVIGYARANAERGRHIIICDIEHHAVLDSARYLETQGFEVTRVATGRAGIVSPDAIESALRDDTILVSIMLANNEIGTLQPIAEIAGIVHERNAHLHTDAVQALGWTRLNVDELGVDMMSLSAHKIHGPKGVGALYVRPGVLLAPLVHGGGQEYGRRVGTENGAGITGLAKAIDLLERDIDTAWTRTADMRDRFESRVIEAIPDTHRNGRAEMRLPFISSLAFAGVNAATLVINLDLEGICVSAGSACASGAVEPSHVIAALGLPPEIAMGSIRFSLGRQTTQAELDRVIEILPALVERLRGSL